MDSDIKAVKSDLILYENCEIYWSGFSDINLLEFLAKFFLLFFIWCWLKSYLQFIILST